MFPKTIKSKMNLLLALIIVAAILFAASQMMFLQRIHSTFENYYSFRGCKQLLKKDSNYAICKTDKGYAEKLISFQNKWYLADDLPFCISNICF